MFCNHRGREGVKNKLTFSGVRGLRCADHGFFSLLPARCADGLAICGSGAARGVWLPHRFVCDLEQPPVDGLLSAV
eukprot:3290320-Prymnesium_polylepis.1